MVILRRGQTQCLVESANYLLKSFLVGLAWWLGREFATTRGAAWEVLIKPSLTINRD